MSYSKIEEGKFVKKGTEYEYVIEADNKDNFRLRVIKEKPVIEKVRTRYDPEIQLFGDKDATMKIKLGYNINAINETLKWTKWYMVMPPASAAIAVSSIVLIQKIPSDLMRNTLGLKGGIAFLVILLALLVFCLGKYIKICYHFLAEYYTAKDLKAMLKDEGVV